MSDVTMPQLGETVTEGTITRWAKTVGERIEQDEVLFEVSTDKVDSEVPSPSAGYLSEILVDEGETVDVGTRLAVISDQAPSGESPSAGVSAAAPALTEVPTAPAATEPAVPADPSGPTDQSEPTGQSAPESDVASPPAPDEMVAESFPPDPRLPAASGARGDGGGGTDRVLSPVVRRLLSEHNLDASQIQGTGAGGRITRGDVLRTVDGEGSPAAPAARAPRLGSPAPAPSRQEAPPTDGPLASSGPSQTPGTASDRPRRTADEEVIPFTNVRRRTAEHMVRSKATSAHTFTAMEVDFHGVDQARTGVRDAFREAEGFSLSYLPFIARSVIDAMADYPRLNASVGDDQLLVHRRINLGVAVDLELEGLIVPVLKDADSKRLRAIAREVRDLAERARSRKLGADEISGGTFTITNPGPFGTLMTVPIINQPQVAILSTDGVKRRPVVAELAGGGEGIVIHPVGLLGLSYDHRAVDGAYASAFLARCREILETRDWAQEL